MNFEVISQGAGMTQSGGRGGVRPAGFGSPEAVWWALPERDLDRLSLENERFENKMWKLRANAEPAASANLPFFLGKFSTSEKNPLTCTDLVHARTL